MSKSELTTFAKKYHIQYLLSTTDPHKKLELPLIANIPMTFVLTPEGKIHKQLLGPQTLKDFESAMGK